MVLLELLRYNSTSNQHENESRFKNFFSKLYNLALLSYLLKIVYTPKTEFEWVSLFIGREVISRLLIFSLILLILFLYLLVERLFQD